MPHDPFKCADTRAWLDKASIDLRAAEVDLAVQLPLLEDALFHCQQAVEKTLKAFTQAETQAALALAHEVHSAVIERLPEEVRP